MQLTTVGISFPFQFIDSNLRNMPGVYAIINIANGKFYVGSSGSVTHRLSQHRCELKRGRHNNPYLLNAYLKNPTSFKFVVIEYSNSFRSKEQEYLDRFYDNQQQCYNLSCTADQPTPRPEIIEKMRENVKQRHKTDLTLRQHIINYNKTPEAKKLHSDFAKQQRQDPQYTQHLTNCCKEKLQKYFDIILVDPEEHEWLIGWNKSAFCREHNLDIGNITRVINGKSKSHKGWHLKDVKKYGLDLQKENAGNLGRRIWQDENYRLKRQQTYNMKKNEIISAIKETNSKFWDILVLSPDGKQYRVGKNAAEFCRQHGIKSRSNFSALLRNKAKTCEGWKLYQP